MGLAGGGGGACPSSDQIAVMLGVFPRVSIPVCPCVTCGL